MNLNTHQTPRVLHCKCFNTCVLCAPVYRRCLLGQTKARFEDEKMLKSNPLAFINGQTHESSAAPDNLVIEIEVSPGHAVPLPTQLQGEKNEVSESQTTEGETYVTVKPTRQAAAAQNFELEVSVFRQVNLESYYKLNCSF